MVPTDLLLHDALGLHHSHLEVKLAALRQYYV